MVGMRVYGYFSSSLAIAMSHIVMRVLNGVHVLFPHGGMRGMGMGMGVG